MPRYLCIQECYYQHPGMVRPARYNVNQIANFKGKKPNPKLWILLSKAEINFDTASEELLLASDEWTVVEAATWLEQHGVTIDLENQPPKARLAKMIVDTRYRTADLPGQEEE